MLCKTVVIEQIFGLQLILVYNKVNVRVLIMLYGLEFHLNRC